MFFIHIYLNLLIYFLFKLLLSACTACGDHKRFRNTTIDSMDTKHNLRICWEFENTLYASKNIRKIKFCDVTDILFPTRESVRSNNKINNITNMNQLATISFGLINTLHSSWILLRSGRQLQQSYQIKQRRIDHCSNLNQIIFDSHAKLAKVWWKPSEYRKNN